MRDANDVGLCKPPAPSNGKLVFEALGHTELDDFTNTNENDLCERSFDYSTN